MFFLILYLNENGTPRALTVGADFAVGLQMLFKSNAKSKQAPQGRWALQGAYRPFNALLLFINQSAMFPLLSH